MAEPLAPVVRLSVGIIGFSGTRLSGGQKAQLSPALYRAMVRRAERYITVDLGLAWGEVELVSGGAAWADHIAVSLFLDHPEAALWLCSPCYFSPDDGRFGTSPLNDTMSLQKTAATADSLHAAFETIVGFSSRAELAEAQRRPGAVVDTSALGFLERNKTVAARSHQLLAFTWAAGLKPREPSGTADTWKKFAAYKHKPPPLHVSVATLAKSAGTGKRLLQLTCDELLGGAKRRVADQ